MKYRFLTSLQSVQSFSRGALLMPPFFFTLRQIGVARCFVTSSVSRSIGDFHFRKSFPFHHSMITKQSKSGFAQTLRKGFKIFFLLEGALLLASYGFWRRLNTSQDFRYYIHQHYPIILEGYYVAGEQLSGNDQLRTFDYKTWTEDRNEH